MSIFNILDKRYKNTPNKIIYRFHDSKGNVIEEKSYKDIYEESKLISLNLLQCYNIVKGDRVIICMTPGIGYITTIWACFLSGIIAVPVYPLDINKFESDLEKLYNIINDSGAKIILTNSLLNNAYFFHKFYYYFKMPSVTWINVDNFKFNLYSNNYITYFLQRYLNLLTNDKDFSYSPEISENDIAFIQFTSGSTSNPKGVALTHKNITSNLLSIFNYETIEELNIKQKNKVMISWLPPYHDMGLIGFLINSVLLDAELNFCSPFDFIKNPSIWMELITKYKGNITSSPNFGFALCNKKIKEPSKYDLSSLEIIMNAAEKIIPETIDNFYNKFKVSNLDKKVICPSYGIAENTIAVSMWGDLEVNICKNELKKGKIVIKSNECVSTLKLQSIGKPCLKTIIKIVDPNNKKEIKDNSYGEIWVSSDSKAVKYWNKEDITKEMLYAEIEDDNTDIKYLRTGDLGFLYEENLFFVSRIKNVINIRGKNFYPEDICASINKINELKPGCQSCFSVEEEKEERIVLICEVRDIIKEYESIVLNIHNIITQNFSLSLNEIILIKERSISKTTSGKIQNYKNKTRYLNDEHIIKHKFINETNKIKVDKSQNMENILKSKDLYKDKIVSIINENFYIPKNKIKDNTVLASYGIDSMQYITLTQYIEDILGIDTDCIMLKDITLNQLVDLSWTEYQNLDTSSEWELCLPKHYYSMLDIENKFKESIPNLDFDNETHILKFESVDEDCVHFNTQNGRFITCASNAYTSLSGHPRIKAAAKDAIDKYGTGIFGPRVVVGASKLLWELESELSDFLSTESAVMFSTAYLAMITVLSCLTEYGICYVFYDDLSHMCILDALKGLGKNVKIFKFKHNDYDDLEEKVINNIRVSDRSKFKLVIADSLFGMDGEFFDLPNFHPICKKYGMTLLLDEAHSLGSVGATGRGIEEYFGMYNTVDIKLGGMNKGMPLLGGWVASNKEICKLLRFRCHGTMFTGTMPPVLLGTALESLRVLKEEPIHIEKLNFNKNYLIKNLREKGFKLSKNVGVTPIIVVIIPNDEQLLKMFHITQMKKLQIFISMFPAVPKGKGRIRISAVAGYTVETMDKIINILYEAGIQSGYLKNCDI